jgi:hypothetical protein
MEILVRDNPVTTFHAPAGIFAGTLVNVGTGEIRTNDGPVLGPRFTFEINVPSMRNQTVLVARTFPPNGAKLQRFLERWLGREFMARHAGKAFDPKTLIGTPAEVTVEHIRNSGHKKPYCNLTAAYPPDTQELTEHFPEEAQDI